MTKWIPRLLGILVVLVLALFVASTWFSPDVPEVLQRDIDLQVRGGGTQPPPADGNLLPESPPEEEPVPGNAPALTLTSLEDVAEEGGAPPLLANPQPEGSGQAPAVTPPPPVQAPPPQQAPAQQARAPAPPPVQTPPAQQNAAASSAGSWIAAGAFGNPDNTKRRVEQLQSRGWPVRVEKIQSGGKTLDRVLLGPIPSGQVNAYLDELNKMGVQGREIQ